MAQFKLKGMISDSSHTQAEIHTLRASGIQGSLNFSGSSYMGPGMGITSASTPGKITIAHNQLVRHLNDLAGLVSDPNGQFRSPEITNLTTTPKFSIYPTANGLAVYEESTRQAFLLPKPNLDGPRDFLETIHDLLLPEWACEQLNSKEKRSSA